MTKLDSGVRDLAELKDKMSALATENGEDPKAMLAPWIAAALFPTSLQSSAASSGRANALAASPMALAPNGYLLSVRTQGSNLA